MPPVKVPAENVDSYVATVPLPVNVRPPSGTPSGRAGSGSSVCQIASQRFSVPSYSCSCEASMMRPFAPR